MAQKLLLKFNRNRVNEETLYKRLRFEILDLIVDRSTRTVDLISIEVRNCHCSLWRLSH